MAKSRDKIRMDEAEIAALFAECKSLQVSTLGPQGEPHLTTLWYTRHEGNVLFETYGKSQKVMNLRRDPRIAVLCEAVGVLSDPCSAAAFVLRAGQRVLQPLPLALL